MPILDHLLAGLKDVCAGFPDKRKGGGVYSMADIGLSAFSLFFMQSESFLSYQRSLEEGRKTSNCRTLFGMARIPTDNHIRSMLDQVHPSLLQPAFDQAVAALRAHGGMQEFQRLDDRILIALDGTEYFCSQKLGCAHCQTRRRTNGKIESYHSMVAASIVAPGHAMVVPLMPEFIVKPDGAEKQDCERNAAKRWLAAHGERMAPLRPIYLGPHGEPCMGLSVSSSKLSCGTPFFLAVSAPRRSQPCEAEPTCILVKPHQPRFPATNLRRPWDPRSEELQITLVSLSRFEPRSDAAELRST